MLVLRMFQSLVAVAFNFITFLCIIRFKFLRSPGNVIVGSLAFCDMIRGFSVLVIPVTRDFFLPGASFIPMCFSSIAFSSVTILVQHSSFSLLAYERFVSLKAAVGKGKKWGFCESFFAVGLSWGLGLLYSAMALIFRRVSPEGDIHMCNTNGYIMNFVTYFGAGIISVTTCITSFFYLRIACMACGSIRATSHIQRRQAELKVAKMLAFVVGIFFVLYHPFVAYTLLVKPDSSQTLNSLYYWCLTVLDVNFWINPIIYAWRSNDFRKAFSMLFKCCRSQKTPTQVSSLFIVRPPISGNKGIVPVGKNVGPT